MEKIKLVLPIMALCVLVACTPIASKKCHSALDAGNLTEAEKYLKEIKGSSECLYYGGMLGKPSTHLVKTIKVDNAKGTANDYQIDCTYSFFSETGDTKLCNFTYKGEAASVIYKYE